MGHERHERRGRAVGYCTNVHPGRTLAEALAEIERHAPFVRSALEDSGRLARGEALPLGAWFSAPAARQLLDDADGPRRLRDRLAARGLVVDTLNGFPAGHFHAARVKHEVYEPNWAVAERLLYTQDLATILVDLLPPESPSASISTVPIGWRPRILSQSQGAALGVASTNLAQLVRFLADLEAKRGTRIHVDLEPEPGCYLDRAADVVDFFDRTLRTRTGDPDPRRHLGVCHDVCHAAVMWESQAAALAAYRDAGIRVGKVQLSSAIETTIGASTDDAVSALRAFAEDRYLHQTTLRSSDGRLRFFEDLPPALEALADRSTPVASGTRLRSHFHVPLAAASAEGLGTTRDEVTAFLAAWPEAEPMPTLEVETYTWSVLPPSMQPNTLAEGIAAEIAWARDAIDRAGVLR